MRHLIRDDAEKQLKNGWYESGGGRFGSPIVAAKHVVTVLAVGTADLTLLKFAI